MRQRPDVVILGCGPTGLGSAWRFHEKGCRAFRLYERERYPGGLAASFTDDKGFVWDIGGHLQFSSYDYFKALSDDLMGGDLLAHKRRSHIWMFGTFIPYPLQRNLRHLPGPELRACVDGLVRAATSASPSPPASYREWLTGAFGDALTDLFFEPYAAKVWLCPTEQMSCNWVSNRVAAVDLDRVLSSIARQQDDDDWGPNATFTYPRAGGTGEMWRRLAARLTDYIEFNKTCVGIDGRKRRVYFSDGSTRDYEYLISSLPIDRLVDCLRWSEDVPLCRQLMRTSLSTVGIGFKGPMPARLEDKMWMYFPEPSVPFYRATIFSRLSPNNVPSDGYWSIGVESADTTVQRHSPLRLDDVVAALARVGVIDSTAEIVSTWTHRVEYGYPVPTLERDAILRRVLSKLEEHGIYSRGRFGLWRYEVSNQDHSFMQGVEAADHVLEGAAEPTAKNGLLYGDLSTEALSYGRTA